ncbi:MULTISPECIES: polyprenyl synthetase family protein [Subtercola]|uniref:Polyprenyl synthetase family protein n=1 Tax=Subtercola vilae TaxID=2056433 RepID=A0A4T2C4T2_9MICO|nr:MULTISPECIES: polyprenyl synthetase family protein [Subtercola]MEA9984785.1 polyprenyl synthetase family protein [Subtercola sp. RTI3]TIH39080.1 polyprenyl synthetase family protein [Subtercola vilae]
MSKGARRSPSSSASFSLTERLFATADDRKAAKAVDEGLVRLEERLVAETVFHDGMAEVSARYLLDAGGKRVRPILAFLTAQLGDGVTDDVVTAATSIELIHLASLYHDDVMDEAEQRRGVPTAHNVWSNSIAILTGDLLFARASKLLSILGERAIRLQADTFERLCLGQLHETVGPRPGEDAIEHYLRVLADKTGSLIAASAQLGVLVSNAPEVYQQAVFDFGEKIGIAFQLVDDVIDLAPPSDATGKTAGTDIRAGVVTLPLLYLQRDAPTDPGAADLLRRLDPELIADTPAAEVDALIAELRGHPVTAETMVAARQWAADAIAALDVLPDGTVKKTLLRFADTMVERSS